jgi:hypothetical protein
VDWDELSGADLLPIAPPECTPQKLQAYIRFVEAMLATGAARRLARAPKGIRATTLPLADLGTDPMASDHNRELYLLNGLAYLEVAPMTHDGPSIWYDLGLLP